MLQRTFVMWSREISGNLHMWHFQFSVWLKSSLGEVHFAENPSWSSGSKVMSNWRILRTIEIKFLFLAKSHNPVDFRLIPLDGNTFKGSLDLWNIIGYQKNHWTKHTLVCIHFDAFSMLMPMYMKPGHEDSNLTSMMGLLLKLNRISKLVGVKIRWLWCNNFSIKIKCPKKTKYQTKICW